MRNSKLQYGFTLVELLVTIAVMAIFAAIALPSMGAMTASAKLNEAASGFVNVMNTTRQEALRQSVNSYFCGVSVKKDGTINGCSTETKASNQYANGIVGFADKDKDGNYSANESLHAFYLKPNIKVEVSALANSSSTVLEAYSLVNNSKFGFIGTGDMINPSYAVRFKFTEADGGNAGKCSIAYVDFGGKASICTKTDRELNGYMAVLCSCSSRGPK